MENSSFSDTKRVSFILALTQTSAMPRYSDVVSWNHTHNVKVDNVQTLAPSIAQLINCMLENGSHSFIIALMIVLKAPMSNLRVARVAGHTELEF